MSWHICQKSIDHNCKGWFLDTQFILCLCLYDIVLIRVVLYWVLKSQIWVLQLCPAFSRLFLNSIWILEWVCQFPQRPARILVEIMLELWISSRSITILAILSLLNHKHGISFHLFAFSYFQQCFVIFKKYKSCTSFAKLIPNVFILMIL